MDTTLSYASDYDQTVHAVRLRQWLIVEIFGVKGRQHRSDDSTPDAVEKMATRYRHAAGLHWAATLAEIERVKRNYQTQVKASRKGEG